jgi:hypothetical protein
MQHPLEVFLTPLGLLPTEDPEDPAWCERVGNVASLIDHTTPLHTVQGLVGYLSARTACRPSAASPPLT